MITQTEADLRPHNGFTHVVDLKFPILGQTLPSDHAYPLFSAVVEIVPSLHKDSEIGILGISGIPNGEGKLLIQRYSALRLRLAADKLPLVLPLSGKVLNIGGHQIRLRIPKVISLQPSATLKSRIVVIHPYPEALECLEAANRQMAQNGIAGNLSLAYDGNLQPLRKVVKVKNHIDIGFSLVAYDLNPEDSLRLQALGLGGRRHFGCGIFLPSR